MPYNQMLEAISSRVELCEKELKTPIEWKFFGSKLFI